MTQQISLISDVINSQVAKLVSEANKQQSYRIPEVVDLGKANELLQGGGPIGLDSFYQTQW